MINQIFLFAPKYMIKLLTFKKNKQTIQLPDKENDKKKDDDRLKYCRYQSDVGNKLGNNNTDRKRQISTTRH